MTGTWGQKKDCDLLSCVSPAASASQPLREGAVPASAFLGADLGLCLPLFHHTRREVDVVSLLLLCLPGSGMEAQQRGQCPRGLETGWLFNRASLLAKTGFHWDFNPQSSGDPSVPLTLPTPAYGEEGRQLSVLRGCREMRQRAKSEAFQDAAKRESSSTRAKTNPWCARG